MSKNDELLRQILALKYEERAAIAHQILASLAPDDIDEDAQAAWVAEIEVRLALIESGDYVARDAWEALEDIRRNLPRRGNGV